MKIIIQGKEANVKRAANIARYCDYIYNIDYLK